MDHKSGAATKVGEAMNEGKMMIQGNHAFDKFNNAKTGQVQAMARAFDDKGNAVKILLDLAQFNEFNNAGQASFTGTHAIKKLNNAESGNVMFNDHKDGQHSTVGETNNAGKMQI